MKLLTLTEVIEKAFKVHGNRYSYFNYISNRDKMKIRCSICNSVFEQLPNNHLAGHGCPVCKGKKTAELQKLSLEEFIKKAQEVHCNKYNYLKTIYLNSYTKVIITCPKHGDFDQLPSNHLSGQGCPWCQASKGELIIKSILEKNNIVYKQQYMIPEIANKLYYDFYLPELNILIEFHGKQHYEYSPFFHRNGDDDFLMQKIRDEVVRHNARQFKYRYLEFNHKQLKKLSKHTFKKLVLKEIAKFQKKESLCCI